MPIVLPEEAQELAGWLAEAVRAEPAELEKSGSNQRYEAGPLLAF